MEAELSEMSIQRRLLDDTVVPRYNYSACGNGSSEDYCLSYYCNRTAYDSAAYSDSCVNQYELLALTLFVTVFLPFCCIGCCCMDGIHTPLRFPTRILPVRKEF